MIYYYCYRYIMICTRNSSVKYIKSKIIRYVMSGGEGKDEKRLYGHAQIRAVLQNINYNVVEDFYSNN